MQNNFTNFVRTPNMNQNPPLIPNAFVPRACVINKPNQQLLPSNNFYSNEFCSTQSVNKISLPCPSSINNTCGGMPISTPQPTGYNVLNNQYYSPQHVKHPIVQNCNINPVNNHFERITDNTSFNNHQKGFSYPGQNVGYSNLPQISNYQGYQNNAYQMQNIPGNVSETFSVIPQSMLTVTGNTSSRVTLPVNNSVPVLDNVNNSGIFSGSSGNPLSVPPLLLNSSQLQNCSFHIPPPILKSDTSYVSISNNVPNTLTCDKDLKVCEFLSKFSKTKEEKGSQITVPEFRSVLKAAYSIMKLLYESKCKLTNLMEASENDWDSEIQYASNLQKQLSEICSLISAPVHLNSVLKKIKFIKEKRGRKKKTKLNKLSQKIKMEQNRKELNQEIDKYLDDIKEKNLKLKREAEMKKEADYILLEVRKKIHEANRTIEKIKVFEKLRNARQINAVQKGLHILSDHNEKFEKKVSTLKETMLKQLADYEAEEKALKVMLETEQEGQLEEEAQWKLKKVKTLQQKKQNHIKECLFGNSEDPLPTDPLFLFHKYHTSANNSIENLVQIRHHWDVHIAEDGEAVPQQWVVPVAASNSSWEQ